MLVFDPVFGRGMNETLLMTVLSVKFPIILDPNLRKKSDYLGDYGSLAG